MSNDNEKRIEYPQEPELREWQRPYLQLPLYSEPPEEYIRQKKQEEEAKEPRRVIIIDL